MNQRLIHENSRTRTGPRFLPVCLALALAASRLAAQAPPPAAPSAAPKAGAGVLVAPTRVVFDSRRRTAEVNLTNTGTAPATFRISLTRMEMDAEGGCREVPLDDPPGPVVLRDLVRYSPRLATLAPQESQAVRIQVRKPADLPTGEYRLYLVFREEPPTAPEPSPSAEPPKGIAIRLVSLFGVAIPVIIRQGDTSAQVALSGLALDPDRRTLRFRLVRSGNQSVHGDVKVTFLPPTGKPQVLAEANGLSVFTPNGYRNMTMTLNPPGKGGGRIHVTYSNPEDQGGALLAEGQLDLD